MSEPCYCEACMAGGEEDHFLVISRQGYSPISNWGYPDRELVLRRVARKRRRPRKYRLPGPNRSQWAAMVRGGWRQGASGVLRIKLETVYADTPSQATDVLFTTHEELECSSLNMLILPGCC